MKRADAQKAIDEAFADALKSMFMVLHTDMRQQGVETASAEFEKGVALYGEAHSAASAVIEKIFRE